MMSKWEVHGDDVEIRGIKKSSDLSEETTELINGRPQYTLLLLYCHSPTSTQYEVGVAT